MVITGAASGMAKVATELGANVYALDLNEVSLLVTQSFKVNMANLLPVLHQLTFGNAVSK